MWKSTTWLIDGLVDCAPQNYPEHLVEIQTCIFRQSVPLPHPRERVRECADTNRNCEGFS
jgi:hypothetical protein